MFLGVGLGLVLGCGLIAAVAIPLPAGPPALQVAVPASPVGASLPTLPFPSQGASAVAIPTLGFQEVHGPQTARPIASLTKLMTAYVALSVLPLAPDESGPTLTVSAADVAEYNYDVRTNQSCVKVAAGEVLTERQLLDGMLVHSASNFASLLSQLAVGSNAAMVTSMNATAQELGMTQTHYVDVSGYDPGSESSALDLLHLSTLLMRNPTFAAVVRQTSVVLPVAGLVTTYTPYLGAPGVVGVKTGTTSEAGGCMVMAFDTRVARRTVQVLAVVLGQYNVQGPEDLLRAAGHAALVLAAGTARHVRGWVVTRAGESPGTLGWPSRGVPVMATTTIVVPVFPGITATEEVAPGTWGENAVRAGATIGAVFVGSGHYRAVTSLVTAAPLTRPDLLERLR
jgi:D-alanyl-D-alanine carboxypeptidase (penicillin-binding protein 5/6)